MSTSSQEDTPVQAASDNPLKKPRLIKTKIVIWYYVAVCLLLLVQTLFVTFFRDLPQEFVSLVLGTSLMILAGGLVWLVLMLAVKLPWFGVGLGMAVICLPLFPVLFLIFRRSWLQFVGMIHHLIISGFLLFAAGTCFYYCYHFDEIEQNDNPGILAFLTGWIGGLYVINAVIFIVFTVMLYYDYRALKKYRTFSSET